jgi:copper chaperone NosL
MGRVPEGADPVRKTALSAGVGLAAFVAAVVFWPSARTGPEPLDYGRDACAHCRMHLARPGFAGELRDGRGVLTKYDDLGCLLRAMLASHREMPEAWVEDHETAELVPLLAAHLVRGAPGSTPMGSGIVAFRDEAAARAFARAGGGTPVAVEELVRDPGRLAQAGRRDDEALP